MNNGGSSYNWSSSEVWSHLSNGWPSLLSEQREDIGGGGTRIIVLLYSFEFPWLEWDLLNMQSLKCKALVEIQFARDYNYTTSDIGIDLCFACFKKWRRILQSFGTKCKQKRRTWYVLLTSENHSLNFKHFCCCLSYETHRRSNAAFFEMWMQVFVDNTVGCCSVVTHDKWKEGERERNRRGEGEE